MEETNAASAAAASSSPAPPPAAEKTPADDAPHLRLDWQETPVHGMESSKFSVQVHHGGYFVGSGETVSYTDEKGIAWFDNLDRNNFKMDTIDLMIDQLCYKERKFVFWCPPGKAINELVEICFEKHCHLMSNASVECKVLLLFLHHLDDHEQQVKEELSHKGGDTDCSEDSEEENFQCDSDGDPAWYDSDYDMKEDDEDFADNVGIQRMMKWLSWESRLQHSMHMYLAMMMSMKLIWSYRWKMTMRGDTRAILTTRSTRRRKGRVK